MVTIEEPIRFGYILLLVTHYHRFPAIREKIRTEGGLMNRWKLKVKFLFLLDYTFEESFKAGLLK